MLTSKEYKYIVQGYKPMFDDIDQMIESGNTEVYITANIALKYNLSLWDSVSLFLGYTEDWLTEFLFYPFYYSKKDNTTMKLQVKKYYDFNSTQEKYLITVRNEEKEILYQDKSDNKQMITDIANHFNLTIPEGF